MRPGTHAPAHQLQPRVAFAHTAGSADILVKPPNILKVSQTKHICEPDTAQWISACGRKAQLPGTFLLNFSRLEILKPVFCCPGCQEVVAPTKTSPAFNPFYFCVGGGRRENWLLIKKK